MSSAPTTRRHALRRMGGLVLAFGAADAAFGAIIVAVRVWPADDYTRVTIESDQPLAARHLLAAAPLRLVVDIDGLELKDALRELVTLGYYRGILNQLDEIERQHPQACAFVTEMRGLAKQFQFETMIGRLTDMTHEK